MEFIDLIRARESIRDYDPDRKVPRKVLENIIGAGRLAPSACNYQPWKFLVISSHNMLEKVKACYPRSWFHDAPHVLVAIGLREQAWIRSYDGYNSVETDVAIAMTHIILAAENEGLGACWIAAFNPSMLTEVIKPDKGETIFAITPLGYPKSGFMKASDKKRKSLKEIAEFI